MRMCVDYRLLNKITQRDRFPLPLIEDLLQRLLGSAWFSKIDLRQGFHQVVTPSWHHMGQGPGVTASRTLREDMFQCLHYVCSYVVLLTDYTSSVTD